MERHETGTENVVKCQLVTRKAPFPGPFSLVHIPENAVRVLMRHQDPGISWRPTTADENCVLALNLAGGTAYCAVATAPDRLVDDSLVRIELAEGLEPAEQLVDLSARFAADRGRREAARTR